MVVIDGTYFTEKARYQVDAYLDVADTFNSKTMNFCESRRLNPPLLFCKLNSLILVIAFLAIEVTCTRENSCRLIREWTWSCEGSHFVPKFHPNTTAVTFTDLQITHLDNKTFQNLTELHILRYLLIKSSHIESSTTGVFSNLKHLIAFEFIRSQIPLQEMRKLFFGFPSTLNKIVIYEVNLGGWYNGIFDGLKRTNFTEFYLTKCSLGYFDGEYFAGMNELRLLSVVDNIVTSINRWSYLPNLIYLDFFDNKISQVPQFKNKTGFPFFPKLQKLFLGLSGYRFLEDEFFSGLDHLRKLGIIIGDVFIFNAKLFRQMKYLEYITLISYRHHIVRFERDVFNSKYLRSIELSNIRVTVNGAEPSELFKYSTQLRNLILRNSTKNIIINYLLKPLTKLENLELSEGEISKIPDIICNMTSLRTLTVQHTSVDEWRNEECPVMKSLRGIRLSYNKIFNVNKTLFSPLLFSNKKLKFDFSHNPYVCDCDILWYRDWMKKNPNRIIFPKKYVCIGPGALKYTHLQNYSVSWEYCNNRGNPSKIAVIGVSVAVLSIIFVLLAILSYTKRWSIRLCIYQLIIRKRKYKALVNNGQYKYDAFVCYCSTDANWVLNKLLPIVEEENHFNLCLHDRDFLVGNDIVDNIVDSMQQSRKVVLVLSNDFAQSSWCQFEASIAQQKILEEHYDSIIPVLLNEIPANLQTKRLGLLLKRKTYLEWPEENQYEDMFWERFIKRLCKSEIDNEI